MEVTTVSPPHISPTEGDDLCEIDVTTVAIDSVTLLISLCGLAGNGAVLRLLGLNNISHFIFDLAVADFFFLLFMVLSTLLCLLEDVSCSQMLPLMYMSFLFQLSMVSYYWGLFQLTAISTILDISTLCELCCRCHLSKRLWWLVWSVQYWAFFLLIAVIPNVTSLCPSHEQEHCQVALISMFTILLLLFAAPVVISRTIDFIKAKCGSQQPQPKRRDIVLFLVVLFTLLLSLCNFLQQLGYIVVPSQVVFMLACINSSIKPFIYFLVGSWRRPCSIRSCWRHCSVGSLSDSLQRAFEEPEENTPSSDVPIIDRRV